VRYGSNYKQSAQRLQGKCSYLKFWGFMTGNDGVHLVQVIVVVFMTGMTSLDRMI